MQQEDQQLARRCRELAAATDRALSWLDENRDTVRSEYDALRADVRRAGRLFRKCETAALRKMCVGVFGPSQSGKSYLISALARDKQGALLADFAGETHDFITEINPEGGKESTGLVTRFTTTPPEGLRPGFPIRLRLLSETDVVRVLANTYYADCEHKEAPDQDALPAALERLRLRAAAPAGDAIRPDADDVEELREYLNKNFASRPRVQMLQQTYWTRAAELAPLLSLEDRAELFGLIWNAVPEFNALFLQLCAALRDLGNPAEAFCPLEALIPRSSGIIDVALLKGLGQGLRQDEADGDRLPVVGAGERTAMLPRRLITALTAEITIHMREKPDDFFDHTDLLDFPGYRSRLKLEDLRRELAREGTLENLFLRGKVAYLFERYCAERELTSMLLCIGPGNQEVQDLPRAVYEWIVAAHGETPARRAGHPPALFFVLTKMDMEFEKKKGTPSVESRWNTRLQSSLLDFFGKQHDWPANWDGAHPFNNVFLLRNPNFRSEAIFTFDGDRESGIRPEQLAYVEEVKQAFLHSDLVRAHVADPARVWDAAMALNDGGVGLLREKLRPLCNPALKREQISVTLAEWRERLLTELTPHWKTDDREEERRRKEQFSRQLAVILASMAEAQQFGVFLRALQVRDHDLYDLYFRAEQQMLREEADVPPQTVSGARVSADDILDDLFGDAAPAMQTTSSAGDPGDAPHPARDEAGRFAGLMLHYWAERLHTLAADPAAQTRFHFPAREFGLFVHELTTAMARLRLRERMEDDLRHAAGYGNIARDRLVWKQVSLAADAINAFVDWLGHDPRFQNAAARTILFGGRTFTLFSPPSPVRGQPHIGEQQALYDRAWYTDWLRALMHAIIANVDFDGEHVVDTEQNNRLRDILSSLREEA